MRDFWCIILRSITQIKTDVANKSHMRTIFFILALLLVIPFHAIGQPNDIRVGVVLPLTGALAPVGAAIRNGITLARKDRPELFKQISFWFEDDQLDAKQSLTAYRNLKSNHNINLLFGFGPILANAIGPLVERDHIPLINFSFEAAPAVGKKFVVRAMNHTDQYMKVLADYLKVENASDFPIVQTNYSFFQAMVGSFRKGMGVPANVQDIATYNPGETDFRVAILKLKKFEGKRIGLFMFPDQLIAFLRQARELGMSASYFGIDLCETAATLTGGNGLLDGCIYSDNDVSPDFREKYRLEFGDETLLTFAGSAYDISILVGELYEDSGDFSPLDFMMRLQKISERVGVLGSFSYRDSPSIGKFFEYPIHVKKVKGTRGVSVN